MSTPVEFTGITPGPRQPGGTARATEVEIERTLANLRRLAAVRGPRAVGILCDGVNRLVESLISDVPPEGRVRRWPLTRR